MSKAKVTEQEIEAAMDLSAKRDFSTSLASYREMLPRAQDDQTKMRILYGIVTCSTWLNLESVREDAILELRRLPDFEVSNAFVVMARAKAFIDFGRAQEALLLIEANLTGGVLQRPDFGDWKYEHLYLKGNSLSRLGRCDEALAVFDEARGMQIEGEYETDILLARSGCLLALSRYDEAYDAASRVASRRDEEMVTLAMQYMAECRMWQSRIPEALELYASIQKRLPCRLVQEERIQAGIKNAKAYLEKRSPLPGVVQ